VSQPSVAVAQLWNVRPLEHFMKILQTLMLAALIALTGCWGATAPKMNRLSVGMTKQEVVSVMGRPDSTSTLDNGVELLHYKLSPQGGPFMNLVTDEYAVKMVNGKVVSYGKMSELKSDDKKN
jgi:hypothetical protein